MSQRYSASSFSPRLMGYALRFTISVAFCYSRESRAVAGHPCSQCKESMVDGVWSDKKDKVFVSAMLLVIAPASWCGGTDLADYRK